MTHYTSVRLCRGGHSTAPRLFLETFRRRLGALSLPVVLVALLPLVLLPPHAMALPQGGQVVAGQVTSAFSGPQLSLDQASRVAIMNWQSFNIAPDEFVRIFQSGPDAAMLARVTGDNPTELLGRLQADGKLFLINPKGILVGSGAVIDTAAFMASTLDVADADFLKGGPLTFRGDSAAGVVNLGRITAREGNVLLLAHTVRNDGEISAPRRTAGLGAGTEIYLASPDSPAFVIRANLPATEQKTGVENSGVITAAQAHLEAAGGSIYDLAINHSGRVQATGVERRPDGRVLLTADGGNVLVTGTAVARKADGSGGEILVGGDFQGKNPAVANAARTYVGPTATLEAGSASIGNPSAPGGRVIVWADGNTRYAGRIETGAEGFVEVSGRHGLDFAGSVNTRGGSLLLDPDDITIVSGSTSVPSGLGDASWTEIEDPGSQTLGTDTLASLLVDGSVSLWAANALTVDAPITVAAGGAAGATLTLRASTLTVNKDISLANVTNGGLRLVQHGGSSDSLTTAAGAALTAGQVTIDGFPITVLNGAVNTSELTYNAPDAASTSLTATNPGNSIAKLVVNTDVADPQPLSFSGNVAVHSGTAMQVSAMIGAANNVTFSSAGNLTVRNEGSAVSTITASGTTKLASTGGVLINQTGASLLAGTGRRLLYTSATNGAFTLGGLTGYTQFDGVSYPNDPNSAVTLVLYNAAGSGPALTLTITANDFMKLYGQPDPTFTASYAGGTAADLTTLPTFSIQQGTHVNVGTYTIVPSGAASSTHSLSYVNGTLTINPATLTYVANAASRIYGDANPAFSGTVTGFVNGDTLASATTGTLAFGADATAASNAGSYGILGSGLTANHGNYTFQQAVGNFSALSVNKAPLTVTFADATRTYGAANPTLTATFSGFRNSDTADVLSDFALVTNATTASPVGTYPITGTPTAGNYAVTVVPGTLTITPAPLTLTGTSVSSVYGDPIPAADYTVSGLLGGDTASVLSGVSFGTVFFGSPLPGTYDLTFASTGTAQNYAVTKVVPGTLTVTRRPLTVTAANVQSIAGAIPPFTSSIAGGSVTGGPGFTIKFAAYQNTAAAGGAAQLTPVDLAHNPAPGTYVIRPVVVPAGGATADELRNAYDFTLTDGVLTLDRPAVPVDYLINATSVILPNTAAGDATLLYTGPQDSEAVLSQDNLKKIDYTASDPVRVKAGSMPISPTQLGRLTRELAGDFAPYLDEMLGGPALTNAQKEIIGQLKSGAISIERFSGLVESDPEVRGAVMTLMAQVMLNKMESGQPLTATQQEFAARMTGYVEMRRQMIKEELVRLRNESIMEQAADATNNQYAIKTMPDIARTAEQLATERLAWAAIGAGGGTVVGAGVAAFLNVPAVAGKLLPYAGSKVTEHVIKETGEVIVRSAVQPAKSIGAAGSAVAVAVVVTLVVITVEAGVMVVQEQQNKDAFNAAMDRANTSVAPNLSNLDLKNDEKARSEFTAAFLSVMMETGFR